MRSLSPITFTRISSILPSFSRAKLFHIFLGQKQLVPSRQGEPASCTVDYGSHHKVPTLLHLCHNSELFEIRLMGCSRSSRISRSRRRRRRRSSSSSSSSRSRSRSRSCSRTTSSSSSSSRSRSRSRSSSRSSSSRS